jgi:hypothetical protein
LPCAPTTRLSGASTSPGPPVRGDVGQHEARPRIVGIECNGAPQEAFPFTRIDAEESRQLDEHLSLCGQRRRIVRGKRQRDVDLPLRAVEVAERREQAPSMPPHIQALAQVAEDGEVRDGTVCL